MKKKKNDSKNQIYTQTADGRCENTKYTVHTSTVIQPIEQCAVCAIVITIVRSVVMLVVAIKQNSAYLLCLFLVDASKSLK